MRYNKDYKLKKIEELSVRYRVDLTYVRHLAMVNDYDMLSVVDKLNNMTQTNDGVDLHGRF